MSHEYHILPRALRWLRRIRHRCGYGVHSPLAFNFITDVIYNQAPYYAYATLRQPLVASISRLDEYDPHSGLTDRDLRLIFRLANYQEATHIYITCAHDGDAPSPILQNYLSAARPSARIINTSPSPDIKPLPQPSPQQAESEPQQAGTEPQQASSKPQQASSKPQQASSEPPASPKASQAQDYAFPADSSAGTAPLPPSVLHYIDTPDALPQQFLIPRGAMLIIRAIHANARNRQLWEQIKTRPDVTLTFDLGRFGIVLNRPKINRQDYIVNYF